MSTVQFIPESSRVCAYCKAIPWPSLPLPKRGMRDIEGTYYASFKLLQDSADQGCLLCQYLWTHFMNHSDISKFSTEDLLKCPVTFTLGIDPDWEEKCIRMSLYLDNGDAAFGQRRYFGFKLHEPGMVGSYTKSRSRKVRGFRDKDLAYELEDLVHHEIMPWIEECTTGQTEHQYCGPLNTPKIIPKRLMEVNTSGCDILRLVETEETASKCEISYLILSYCWGDGNAIAKTTRDNINQRLNHFALTDMPKTIQDAIRLTRLMGFQYLWVDAVCILQSSDDYDPGEFKEEAIRMGDYYANAACCISASLADDSSEGFLKARPCGTYPIQPMALRLTTTHNSESQSIVITGDAEYDECIGKAIASSPLMQRGWYLQELLLSRRILHWTRYGLFRECRSCWFVEGSQEKWQGAHTLDQDNPRDCLAIANGERLSVANWCHIIEIFCKMRLTFPNDRHYATLGTASMFSKQLGSESVQGVFRCALASGLAWTYPKDDLFGNTFGPPVPKQTQFPTWSWASNGSVTYQEIDEKSSFVQESPLLETESHSQPNHAVQRRIDYSKLHLRAPLITIRFERGTLKLESLRDQCWVGVILYTYIPDNHLGSTASLSTTASQATKDGTTAHWLLLAAEAHPSTRYCGLLVQQAEGEEQGTYQRYGFLSMEWRDIVTMGTRITECFDKATEITLM